MAWRRRAVHGLNGFGRCCVGYRDGMNAHRQSPRAQSGGCSGTCAEDQTDSHGRWWRLGWIMNDARDDCDFHSCRCFCRGSSFCCCELSASVTTAIEPPFCRRRSGRRLARRRTRRTPSIHTSSTPTAAPPNRRRRPSRADACARRRQDRSMPTDPVGSCSSMSPWNGAPGPDSHPGYPSLALSTAQLGWFVRPSSANSLPAQTHPHRPRAATGTAAGLAISAHLAGPSCVQASS